METNEALKEQATALLKGYEMAVGVMSITGSFVLDLMVCPDLDLYCTVAQVKSFFALADVLYRNRLTAELYIQKGSGLGLPEGEHIQVRTNLCSARAKWKMDIWMLPGHVISGKLAEIDRIRKRLTDSDRREILDRAYLDEGIRDLARLKDYLRREGIAVV